MRDNSHFGGESLNVLRFLLKKAFRYEEREICVLMAGFLEHAVQCLLHLFPYGVTVGPDDHAALNRRVIREFRSGDHVGVPSGKVFAALGDLCFGHNLPIIALCV